MQEKQNKSKDGQPMNKTNPSAAFKFDLNEPYYEEDEEIHLGKASEQEKKKSKDVLLNEISPSSTHKFDLNKPYFEEEEQIHPNEAMEQQVSKSANVSSTNKTNLST
ncbi:unnamed protein product, partial [Arabidopsis halleri]